MEKFKFREHRGSLLDSMDTVREFKTKQDLVDHLQKKLDQFGRGKYDVSKMTVEPYVFDHRIGWDTHLVHLAGYGVLGYTNRQI